MNIVKPNLLCPMCGKKDQVYHKDDKCKDCQVEFSRQIDTIKRTNRWDGGSLGFLESGGKMKKMHL